MSLNDEERRIIVNLEYEKAVNTFKQIEGLKGLGYWDNIANRLYYMIVPAKSLIDSVGQYISQNLSNANNSQDYGNIHQ